MTSSPAVQLSRSRTIAGWVLVSAATVVGVITVWFAGGMAAAYGPTSGIWSDGAWWALSFGAFGVGLATALAVLAMVFGTGLWVRVLAAVVVVGTVVGVMAYGGSGVVARYAGAPKAPDCVGIGPMVDPQIQAAFEELEHPGWVDTLVVGEDACAAAVRNHSVAEAIGVYSDQLVGAGWVIDEVDESHLQATRDGFSFRIYSCPGEDIVAPAEEAWIEITADSVESLHPC